jgi:hypothetical protein
MIVEIMDKFVFFPYGGEFGVKTLLNLVLQFPWKLELKVPLKLKIRNHLGSYLFVNSNCLSHQ